MYANLVNQSVSSMAELFKRLRDFLCKRNGSYDYSTTGVGWTLHDAVYAVDQNTISANDYFVVYSPGEDGNQDLYFRFLYVSTTQISITAYLYWNNSTHVGVQSYGVTATWTVSTAAAMWVYADLDSYVAIGRSGTSYSATMGGCCPESPIAQDFAASPSSITSGANRTVTFSSVPAGWAVNKYLFVRDNASIERVQITVISGNDVTFANFANSYAAGCKFSAEITYWLMSQATSDYYLLIRHTGAKAASTLWASSTVVIGPTPDPLTGKYSSRRALVADTNGFCGPFKNQLVADSSHTAESLHTVSGSDGWRYFNAGRPMFVKEV